MMNIFHQLRTGRDLDFKDICAEDSCMEVNVGIRACR